MNSNDAQQRGQLGTGAHVFWPGEEQRAVVEAAAGDAPSGRRRAGGRRSHWLPLAAQAAAGTFALFVLTSLWLVVLLRWVPPPTSAFMIQKGLEGFFAAEETGPVRYQWVDYERISPHAKLAVVAAEDQHFRSHAGFDFNAIEKAWVYNKTGKRLRGASTISQQVAKNLFLWPGRSYLRKGLEAYFTILIELLWSKQRILEVYLNIAQMGEQVFGVEAAAKAYFKTSASRLSAEQAALIAAVLPNPADYSAIRPSRYVHKRQQWILRQMRQLGGRNYLADL